VTRNQHHRERDHFGLDYDTYIATTSGVGDFPEDTLLHTVLQNVATTGLSIIMDGYQTPIRVGNRGWVEVPFPATITYVRMLSDQVCNVVVDIWKTTFASYPPSAANSICASMKPTISGSSIKAELGTLQYPMTGWTTSVDSGDILWFHVDSNDVSTLLTISMTLARSS